jgi:glycosyltransferase involved in cell wall biosynthesis
MKINIISVIVPVYNVEQYLTKCLDSIINQTYKNLEIILINDGSTDTSAEICDNYASNDSRIKVIHKRNGGLSDARNSGLKICSGDYICFIDSDDIIALTFCEKMLEGILKYNVEIIECNFLRFKQEDKLINYTQKIEYTAKLYDNQKALELLMKEEIKQMVCTKLFNSKLIEGILFETDKTNEDEFWTYQIVGKSKGLAKISNVLYFYRQNPASIMGKKYSLSRLDGLLALQERILFIKKHFPSLENLAIKTFCLGSIWHFQQIEKNPIIDPNKVIRKKNRNEIEVYNKISILKKWKLKEIFLYVFFLVSPFYFAKIRNYMLMSLER